MKDKFPEYYRLSDKDLEDLMKRATFAFDANVLLDVYRVSPKTSEQLLGLLLKLRDRIWIPYQFASEYHNHKDSEQDKLPSVYTNTKSELEAAKEKFLNQIKSRLTDLKRKTLLDVEGWVSRLEQAVSDHGFNELLQSISEYEEQHVQRLKQDGLQDRIADIFSDRVGDNYEPAKLEQIYKEGEIRYAKKQPPGYDDDNKEAPRKYGDLVGWYQLIDHAIDKKMPIILITGDTKEGWYDGTRGNRNGPRRELIREMLDKAKVQFYIYTLEQFAHYANVYLDSQISEEALQELETLKALDETSSIEIVDIDPQAALNPQISPQSISQLNPKFYTEFSSETQEKIARYRQIQDRQIEQTMAILDEPLRLFAARNREFIDQSVRMMAERMAYWTMPLTRPTYYVPPFLSQKSSANQVPQADEPNTSDKDTDQGSDQT